MACIYQITNLINGKFYIGSTQKKDSYRRKSEHFTKLRANYHNNKHLQYAWNKYGEENFEFSIIEEFEFPKDYDRDYKYEYITGRELFYINTLNPQYNIMREVRGGKLGRKLSDKEKDIIGNRNRGKVMSEETKNKLRVIRAKQVITEETKLKISKKLKGRIGNLGYKQSEEQKQNTSKQVLEHIAQGIGMHSKESKEKRTNTLKIVFNTPKMKEKLKTNARNRSRRLFLCFKDGLFINEFDSQIEASEILGFNKPCGISAVLNKIQYTHRGYIFIYKDQYNGKLDR